MSTLISFFSSLYGALYESFADMTQNQVSLLVIVFLCGIIFLLIAASVSETWRAGLVKARFLEKDESPRSLLNWVIVIVLAVKLFQAFIIQPFIVDGGSMLPTFHDKEFLLVDKLSYDFHQAARGDVVIFKLYEQNGSQYAGKYLIKRVIGLPGERIVIKNGTTTIYNTAHPEGFTVDEPFIEAKDTTKDTDTTLTKDQYFVMGDNRVESYDSRIWGPLQSSQLRGRVLLRVYPFSVFGLNPGEHPYNK